MNTNQKNGSNSGLHNRQGGGRGCGCGRGRGRGRGRRGRGRGGRGRCAGPFCIAVCRQQAGSFHLHNLIIDV